MSAVSRGRRSTGARTATGTSRTRGRATATSGAGRWRAAGSSLLPQAAAAAARARSVFPGRTVRRSYPGMHDSATVAPATNFRYTATDGPPPLRTGGPPPPRAGAGRRAAGPRSALDQRGGGAAAVPRPPRPLVGGGRPAGGARRIRSRLAAAEPAAALRSRHPARDRRPHRAAPDRRVPPARGPPARRVRPPQPRLHRPAQGPRGDHRPRRGAAGGFAARGADRRRRGAPPALADGTARLARPAGQAESGVNFPMKHRLTRNGIVSVPFRGTPLD